MLGSTDKKVILWDISTWKPFLFSEYLKKKNYFIQDFAMEIFIPGKHYKNRHLSQVEGKCSHWPIFFIITDIMRPL